MLVFDYVKDNWPGIVMVALLGFVVSGNLLATVIALLLFVPFMAYYGEKMVTGVAKVWKKLRKSPKK